jgi:hypothetical protein
MGQDVEALPRETLINIIIDFDRQLTEARRESAERSVEYMRLLAKYHNLRAHLAHLAIMQAPMK